MSPTQVLERERRWAQPVAILGFLSALLLITGVVVRQLIPAKDNASDQIIEFAHHGNALGLSSILMALGFLAAAAPFTYLFLASAARNPRVRRGLVFLCVLGPLLFGVRLVMASYALKDAGEKFIVEAPSEPKPKHDLATLKKAISSHPDTLNQVSLYNTDTPGNVAEVELDDGTFYTVSFPASAEADLQDSLDKAGVDNSEDSSGKAGDAFATHLAVNSSGFKAAGALALPAGLAMIFAIVYPALQAFRVGLISRMYSTIGAIVGASLIILPQAPLLIGLWLVYFSLLLLDRLPGERPAAWSTGTAVPWPRPGEPPPDAPVEGTAREIDPDQPAANAPRQRGERRKRKRRG